MSNRGSCVEFVSRVWGLDFISNSLFALNTFELPFDLNLIMNGIMRLGVQ